MRATKVELLVYRRSQQPDPDSSKDQQHSQGRAILRQVECLQANLSHTIDSKSRQHMDDVVGFFQAMHDEVLITTDGRRINQGLRCDPLGFEL